MLDPTDPMPAPDLALAESAHWFLPRETLDLLARVAPTVLPVLCTACFGAAFRRVASGVHLASGRDELLFVDLRRSAGTLPAGLPEGGRAGRATLALDGIEHVDGATQDVLAAMLLRAPYRLVCATDTSFDVLRARWRADLLARLSTVTVATPALARRGDEIGDIAHQRLLMLCRATGRAAPELAPDATAALAAHPWPGDLAELDAVLSRTLLAVSSQKIAGVALRFRPDGPGGPAGSAGSVSDGAIVATALPIAIADGIAPADPPAIEAHATPTRRAGAGCSTDPDECAAHDAPFEAATGRAGGAGPDMTGPPVATAGTTDGVNADEALIATLPAPGLFRARRGDQPPTAPSGSIASTVHSSPAACAAPTLEALAVELAHQLKNPLVTIKTFVASIESLRDDPQELGPFRSLTEEAVTRMDGILDGLLAFARLHVPVLEPIDVLSLLRDALRIEWRVLSAKRVELDAPDGAALRASADRDHVRFALATLARHVSETIEPRSRLAITVEEPATLRLEYRESGAITHLRGVSNGGGSGLPLALLLVRGALARAGGDVEIALESNVVSIRLRLPAS